MNWLKQWFAARKQRQLARFVTGFCFLMALAIPQAQAQDSPTGSKRALCALTMRESCHPHKTKEKEPAVQNSTTGYKAVQQAVKGLSYLIAHAKNPGSMALDSVDTLNESGVCIVYRGENGFGGVVRALAYFDEKGEYRADDGGEYSIPRILCGFPSKRNGTDITSPTKKAWRAAQAAQPPAEPEFNIQGR